ncbi:hypothetical protein PTSG_04675 [Salpingoeca rosetta]|uniref:Uncharacterized protein n=1 Tax=Salpingoeca rosetta (strain ATCC 50818 / BSB-021) TaxID=946362 RepID=F2U838_SALR5|nr:uncharacterized protein PTSG_04675 [Salpingoeca rosetta]EGD72943.1 hypothetical protein PTSG_04675 [Salpingoeca rosetta]|eukprot:XP_004994765.1 hypothetical protein PTSG_04675 [Salpingoeca rosetta]
MADVVVGGGGSGGRGGEATASSSVMNNNDAAAAGVGAVVSEISGKLQRVRAAMDGFLSKPTTRRINAYVTIAARWLVCAFHVNWALTQLELWYFYGRTFPWLLVIFVLPAATLVCANVKPAMAATVLLISSFFTFFDVMSQVLWVWFNHGSIYVNELMVKKLAIIGAMSLVILREYNPKHRVSAQQALASALFLDQPAMTNRKSAFMLAGRLLLSTLFVWVGVKEIQRQMENTIERNGHVYRRRPVGDGHDAMWYKLLEFALSIPFMLGLFTSAAARALACVLLLEALTAWAWWRSTLSVGYRIHAREHFAVNVSVAGGLLLLCAIGAGKYTVDELLKKKDS